MDLIKALLKLTLAGALSLSALLVLSHYWSNIESWVSSNTYVHLSCIETTIESSDPRFQPSHTIVKIAKKKSSGEPDINSSELSQWPLSLLQGGAEEALKSYPAPQSLWPSSRGPLLWLFGDNSSANDTTYRFDVVSGYRDNTDISIDRKNLSFKILEEYLSDSCAGADPRTAQALRETRLCSTEEVKLVHASGTCEIIAAEEYALKKDNVLERYSEIKELKNQNSETQKAREQQSREQQELEAREAQKI